MPIKREEDILILFSICGIKLSLLSCSQVFLQGRGKKGGDALQAKNHLV
jgi:hypothetical protein